MLHLSNNVLSSGMNTADFVSDKSTDVMQKRIVAYELLIDQPAPRPSGIFHKVNNIRSQSLFKYRFRTYL